MPSLSVIVPVYNVRDYLLACLQSLSEQTLDDLEVILVDDGSTDGSGDMTDRLAAGRPGWRVLHVDNGGLGRARNIGLDQSSGEFVAFVDSDDLVPRDAYELMFHAVRESGSDMVCGHVRRFDGARTYGSPLHRRAITRTRMRTHIHEMPSLIYDTTAWNKIYRRTFLLQHDLRFPEGVYYEDIPLTIPAHFLASSVDVLQDPVYLWRERQTVEQSITQRRSEIKNLVDRLAAVSSVDDFLTTQGDAAGKALHDHKVLTLDIPLFLDVLHEGDEQFQLQTVALAGDYLRRVEESTLRRLTPLRRLQYHLISRGMLAELLEVQEFQRTPANRGQFVRSGLRMFADLPFRTDAGKQIPAAVYEVTRSQPLRTGIRDVWWEGDELVVDGHAFIHRVQEASRFTSVRRLQLRKEPAVGSEPGDEARQRVRSERVSRPDLTGRTVGAAVSYDAAGFRAHIGKRQLVLAPSEQQASYELVAQLATVSARRGSAVGNPEFGRARHPARAFVAADQLAVPAYHGRRLSILVRRVAAVLHKVEAGQGSVTFTLRPVPGADLSGRALFLRRTDALHALLVPLVLSGGLATATVSAADLEIRASSLGMRFWHLGLALPGQDPAEEPLAVLDLDPAMADFFAAMGGRSITVRQAGASGAVLSDTQAGLVLTDFAWSADGLRLSGLTNDAPTDSLLLGQGSGARLTVAVTIQGDSWSALVPARGNPGEPVLRWLAPGRWRFLVETGEDTQRELPLRLGSAAEQKLGRRCTVDELTYLLRTNGAHQLQLVVDASGDWRDRGALRRRRARRYHYRLQRRLPLEDTILFEAWKGRQYSDNPRAIFEELQRRGDGRRMVWAVSDYGIEVPDGVERVIVGGRAYFRHLARARWLVSNDSMPTHYVKRPGTRYGQTWHGTPLKRIGFDIENLQMSNKNYLVQFAEEVKKWDALVSPNAFSTQILRRAFHYEGEVLEIGYPRNDIFYREADDEARREAVRRRLRLPEGKRVVLYAPTWRDDDYNANGRYLFTMKLDLERMHRELGDDSVLLIRGHQLVSGGVDISMFGDFTRNVSRYPDISDLYAVSDVLVTDYSSVMFDFVNTGRPMLFFTWDLASYRDELRGFYFDFEAEAPGPLLSDTSGVVDALRSLDQVSKEYAGKYDAFREKFASLEDGRASARFVDRFLS